MPKADDDGWKHCDAKKHLCGLIVDGVVPDRHSIKPKQVFEVYCKDRPEFKDHQDYSKFADRLLRLRKKAEKRSGRAQVDADCLNLSGTKG